MIEGFPSGEYNQEDVIKFVEDLWKNIDEEKRGSAPLKIQAVHICYKMGEARKLIKTIQDLAIQLSEFIDRNEGNEEKYKITNNEEYLKKKAETLKEYKELETMRANFESDKSYRKKLSSSCIFVNFESIKQQEILVENKGNYRMTIPKEKIEMIKQSCCSKFSFPVYNDKYVKLIKAPEPSDVLWNNCEH